jgi:hypothetical protein
MTSAWTSVPGVLVKGYGVASGPSQDYPYGTLERQIPIFRERGLDLSAYFLGTLNIDIRPATFDLVKPEFTFRDVRWTDLHPPEHFSFSRCKVVHQTATHDGWIYYPHPETKRRNFQNRSLIEVIAAFIARLNYGDPLEILLNPDRIALGQDASAAAGV